MKQGTTRHLLGMLALLVCATANAQSERAQELALLPPQIDEAQNLVIARKYIVAGNQEAGVLRLPDGSTVRTVWTAALAVNPPQLGGEPLWPRCEPAVYSLARMTQRGVIVWAKSYVYSRPEFSKVESCSRDYYGYSIYSPLGEVTAPGYYELPFKGLFYIGDPKDRANRLTIDAETGQVIQDTVMARLRTIDASALGVLKQRISQEIYRHNNADRPSEEKERSQQLFVRVEKALFPNPNSK